MTTLATRTLFACAALAGLPLAPGCRPAQPGAEPAHADSGPVAAAHPAARDFPGLHNVVEYAAGVYSGAAPQGPAGFDSLLTLGVRTIVSVDGASPDVEQARARGLRYVHLPIGYNGIDRPRVLEIARALRDLPGPTYVHCHHGKHRSAAAAAAALVALGRATPQHAARLMQVSGTSPTYRGLFACVAATEVASPEQIASASDEFPEVWKTSGLVQSMVDVDEAFDHLKAIERAGWKTPSDHPDLVPAAEAGRMADLLRVLADDPELRQRPAEFLERLRAAADAAQSLEAALAVDPIVQRDAAAMLERVSASCRDCHANYRD